MTLFKHQTEAIEKALKLRSGIALFHEPGLGKTLTALQIFTQQRSKRPGLRLLVVCPLSLIKSAWGEDIERFTPYSWRSYNDIKKISSLIYLKEDIIIINYDKLIYSKHFQAVVELIRKDDFMIAVDESSRMKNHKSKTTQALLKMAHLFSYKIIMSGSPMPNSEMELWAQLNFIAPDILRPSFYAFRNTYFELGRGNQTFPSGSTVTRLMMREMMRKGFQYRAKRGAREKIMQTIDPVCHWVKKAEALDLPEYINEFRDVTLSGPEQKSFKEMKNDFVTSINDEDIFAQNALTKMMKLRQGGSGFYYNEDHATINVTNNPAKLKELKYLLDELGEKQVIIWCEFREEARAIAEHIESLGRSAAILNGATKDKDLEIKRFKSGEAQYLIANPQSAAHGLTFVNCDTAIFYSYSFSYEQHYQARERIYRIGQKNKCLYIYLVGSGTLDPHLLKVIRDKQDLQAVIYNYVKENRG